MPREATIVDRHVAAKLSKRAEVCFDETVESFAFCDGHSIPVIAHDRGRLRWWTFAGARANAMVLHAMRDQGIVCRSHDDLAVVSDEVEERRPAAVAAALPKETVAVAPDERMIDDLKFSACLPRQIASEVLEARLGDREGYESTASRPIRLIRGRGGGFSES